MYEKNFSSYSPKERVEIIDFIKDYRTLEIYIERINCRIENGLKKYAFVVSSYEDRIVSRMNVAVPEGIKEQDIFLKMQSENPDFANIDVDIVFEPETISRVNKFVKLETEEDIKNFYEAFLIANNDEIVDGINNLLNEVIDYDLLTTEEHFRFSYMIANLLDAYDNTDYASKYENICRGHYLKHQLQELAESGILKDQFNSYIDFLINDELFVPIFQEAELMIHN